MTKDIARLELLAGDLIDEHDRLLTELKAQRRKHNLTQNDVAERMGVSQPTVAAFEHYDSNPTLASVRRYALAVGANIEHTVTDACCTDDDSFEAIVKSVRIPGAAGAIWSKSARLGGWKTGDHAPAPVRHVTRFESMDA
ncbi:helix-turn-helix domain-containing protein [Cryobacterium sp. TMT4-31]|uniref:helix-turn-helix domain-containing protein n=1 Tax=Cryobacterium sp. TMT4-31 TaxID=1259259 RepID=UPI00106A434F|nr:helix-turn-helix transcriptional regulator [Cryobacterium sp. TMT4-31]TFC87453.1 XRE family transcriptional regulator [Cryobacterium sp. TMT4-31]